MLRRIRPFIALPLLLLIFGTALAGSPLPQHNAQYWQVAFWDNDDLSGQPVLTAAHKTIAWDWGNGSPDAILPKDHFSGRWRRPILVDPGTYRFQVTSDDGVRLYIDNVLIIDEWYERQAAISIADVPLAAGQHLVVLEYFEHTGLASLELSWARLETPEPRAAWRAEYFANPGLRGMPAKVRDEQSIDHNWGSGSPSAVLPKDRFSVRWTRTLDLEPGMFQFTATSDDGVRLWVNGHLLIDQWHEHPPTTYSGTIYVKGTTKVKLEYFENGGEALVRLQYGPQGDQPHRPLPTTIIVDDAGHAFARGGKAAYWQIAQTGFDGQMTWTRNNDRIRPHYNWARWYPGLAAGKYEVYVHIPQQDATTRRARYWVSHADGYTLRLVDQGANSGWVSLGSYNFRGNRRDYVSLADVTFEPHLSAHIGFDAVKWIRLV